MNTTFGLIALVGFLLSLLVHILALAGVDVQSHVPAVWVLHAGIFIVFIPMVWQLKSSGGKNDPLALLRDLPRWAGFAIAVLMVYVAVNFFIAFGSNAEGSPAMRDGSFVLERRGVLVRKISEAQYHAQRAATVRGFSGHWLIFYFVPLAHFLLRRKAR